MCKYVFETSRPITNANEAAIAPIRLKLKIETNKTEIIMLTSIIVAFESKIVFLLFTINAL